MKQRLERTEEDLRRLEAVALDEGWVREALERLDPVWEQLFPGEQARIVQLLVDEVVVREDGLDLALRSDGLRSLAAEITGASGQVPERIGA